MEKQMEKQTPERIKQEIEHLMAIKPTVLRWSFFGDDHHAAIDAQIFVLQTTMEEDDIHEEMGHDADNVLDEHWRRECGSTGSTKITRT